MSKSCKIILKDEVNARIEGIEPSVKRQCIEATKVFDPASVHYSTYKLGNYKGYKYFMDQGGNTFINILDKIIPVLRHNSYSDIQIEDNRNKIDYVFDHIDKNIFADLTWWKGHKNEGESIVLKDHQVEIVNHFLDNIQSNIEAATNAGKTAVIAALSKCVLKYGRIIVIVPNRDLVDQTSKFLNLLGIECGKFYGGLKEFTKDVTICTWQSLQAVEKKTREYEKLSLEDINTLKNNVACVIADECHTVTGDVLTKILSKTFKDTPIRWGMTGTIPKEEYKKIKLQICIGPVVYNVETKELQEAGVSANISNINILQLRDTEKFESYPDEINYLSNHKNRLKYISECIANIVKTGNTLVLVHRIELGKELTSHLETNGVDCSFVHGSTKDRKDEYESFMSKDNKVLLATFGVASTGLDMPRIFNLIIIDAGKAFTTIIQSIGRSLRIYTDKDTVSIWDICSTTKYSKKHMNQRIKYYKEKGFPHNIIKVIDWNLKI